MTEPSNAITLGALNLERPSVMGILNVTPDSFSDGGRFDRVDAALAQAMSMLEDGAAIIDVGGESTRPGADAVDADAEADRVVPVIEAIRRETDAPISVDTSKPEVMVAAAAAGASMINDVRSFLEDRVVACEAAGIARDLIVLDPGFGFGKSVEHNIRLLANLRQLAVTGLPLMAGLSRKSTLGVLTGRPVGERMPASVAAATIACLNGADILRVHDVAETCDAVRIVAAVMAEGDQAVRV